MTNKIQEGLWRQFGASIDMLQNAISFCPESYFTTNKRFYYLAYHCVLFLDYYLSIPPKDFSPILPFTIKDKEQRPLESIGDIVPDKIYSKEELIDYINKSRLKCKALIESLTDNEKLNIRFTEGNQEGDMDYPILEILLYNLRHTQHHIGQLNLIMRQDLHKHMEWAFRADEIN
ncbi:MAG: DinB family protein [Chitinophagaceae bacterium]|nr:DinB family protein [Chitinophagaceae bacterium]